MSPSGGDPSGFKAGDRHYMAYVGPPQQYDIMGATQFRLLCALGLRSGHQVLDLGCGSLRAGRLLIPYLDPGRYHGIEPNEWLIDEAIRSQIGEDLIRIKRPRFNYNDDFSVAAFGKRFDYVLAQSIFSHAGRDLIMTALGNVAEVLDTKGLFAATFVEGVSDFDGSGWVYPGVVHYRRATIRQMAQGAGLGVVRLPWYHPRQTWYLLAKNERRLPPAKAIAQLTGPIVRGSDFTASWSPYARTVSRTRRAVTELLPRRAKSLLRRVTH